jgi:PAS domain S-box-containing protein
MPWQSPVRPDDDAGNCVDMHAGALATRARSPVRLLIVDDDVPQMRALCATLELEGFEARGFSSPKRALQAVGTGDFDLLITDLSMSEMDGITLLKASQRIDASLDAIVMTGYGTIDTAVRAMQAGAFDYILKPFKLNVIMPLISRALEVKRLRRENLALRERLQSEDRASAMLEHSAIGMALLTPRGHFLKVNVAMCETLGFTEGELLRTDFKAVVHADDLETDAALMRQVLAGTIHRYQIEKRFIHKDGHFIWALLSISPVFKADRSVDFFVSQIQDISARKEIDRIKGEFVATISHELRTPLTSIRGSLGLVAGGAAGTLPEGAARFIEIARRNTDRLTRMVNDILDVQMIQSGQMTLDLAIHMLAPLVERAIVDNQDSARMRRVRLTVSAPLPVVVAKVDPNRMVQALGNLLSNATKFSPAEAEVEIGMTVDDGTVCISVTDHGPGVPASYRQRIFASLSQADSSDRRHAGGTGLGLTIGKALIECMGGRIGYRTDAGVATTFFFELPVTGMEIEGVLVRHQKRQVRSSGPI